MKATITALAAAAACATLAIAQPAEANLVISGGATGSTSTALGNDLINSLYGVNSVGGTYYGNIVGAGGPPSGAVAGELQLDTASTLSFTYLGSEAGYHNVFDTDGGAITYTTPGLSSPSVDHTIAALGSASYGTGAIDFSFLQNGNASNTATNGDAPSDYCTDCSMFVVFLDPTTLKPLADQSQGSTVADVFFNDGNTDDNHDDMGVRISVSEVPIPAALPIIGAAFAGFGFAGFRSRRTAI